MAIDLHTHSTASDGDLAPAAVVALAAEHGVTTLALTDHDTLAGLPEAAGAAAALGVRFIPGIEISVGVSRGQFHLVGYLPGLAPPPMVAAIDRLQRDRADRVATMLEALQRCGVPVHPDALRTLTAGTVGRPHIAQAMVDAGHCATREEAFRIYLDEGRPAFAPQRGITPHDAVRLVREAGGVPVLAHPWTLRVGNRGLEAMVASLAHVGLVGIEVHRPDQSPEQRDAYARIARRLGLVPSGGSDFHRTGWRFGMGDTGTPGLPADTAERLFHAVGQGVPSPDDHR